jgi:hypothetical protein
MIVFYQSPSSKLQVTFTKVAYASIFQFYVAIIVFRVVQHLFFWVQVYTTIIFTWFFDLPFLWTGQSWHLLLLICVTRTSTEQSKKWNVINICSGWSWKRDAGWPVMLIFRILWENSTLPSPHCTMLKTSAASLSLVYPGGTIKCFYVKGTLLEIINIFFHRGDLVFLLVAELFSERLSIVAAKIK